MASSAAKDKLRLLERQVRFGAEPGMDAHRTSDEAVGVGIAG
jgi:hypothetical protein